MPHYELTPADVRKGRRLLAGAIAAPFALPAVPAAITLLLMLVIPGGPPTMAVIFFFGLIITLIAFVTGLIVSGVLGHRRTVWTRELRERLASDGIRADEIEWFRHELRSNEKRSLKAVSSGDPLIADAYRDALASRLTATRIVRSSRRELGLAKKRQNSLRPLKGDNAESFRQEIAADIEKISRISDDAKAMLVESEARLQMIEAAAYRGGTMVDSEIALKKLAARSAQLPLALESAKMADDIRAELEADLDLSANEKNADE